MRSTALGYSRAAKRRRTRRRSSETGVARAKYTHVVVSHRHSSETWCGGAAFANDTQVVVATYEAFRAEQRSKGHAPTRLRQEHAEGVRKLLRGEKGHLEPLCEEANELLLLHGAGNGDELLTDTWLPDLLGRDLPITEGVDPLDVLITEADTNKMISKGLPAARISVENGAIVSACKRWPLIIDPQLQGITWIRKRETPNGLMACQQSFGGYLDILTKSMD